MVARRITLIDGRSLQDRSAVRGIGTYLRGLLSGFAELGVAKDVELVLRGGLPIPREVEQFGLRTPRGRIPNVLRRLQPLADPFFVAKVLRRLRPQLYHGVEYAQPITSSIPVVITVHDLIPFVFPRQYPWMRRERLLALRLLRHADALIADSNSTAHDLVRLAGVDSGRIHVVPLGVSEAFVPADPEAIDKVRANYGTGQRRYVLAVGAFDPRKRIDLLASAAAQLRRHHDVDLVIAGAQGAFEGRVRAALAACGVDAHTHHLGYVPQDDLIALYGGAECLLFTSEYEGFGLPPLEAMACGTPVAMFDNSSLREIAGEAAMVVADGDAPALGEAAARLLSDPAEQCHRRQRGTSWAKAFTWRRTAGETLSLYEALLTSH